MAADLQFDWDPAKNTINVRKHKVDFEEAATVFMDENALLIGDPDHSDSEDRFILLGMSASLRVLLVCHCYKPRIGLVRLISARKADPRERLDYFRRFMS